MAPARTDISATIDKEDEAGRRRRRVARIGKINSERTWPYLKYLRLSPSLFPVYSLSFQYASSSNTSLCIMSLTSFGFYLCQILAPSS